MVKINKRPPTSEAVKEGVIMAQTEDKLVSKIISSYLARL